MRNTDFRARNSSEGQQTMVLRRERQAERCSINFLGVKSASVLLDPPEPSHVGMFSSIPSVVLDELKQGYFGSILLGLYLASLPPRISAHVP